MAVVKDLVTDMDDFWAKLRARRPWLFPPAGAARPRRRVSRVAASSADMLAQGVLCLECGLCYSDCNALDAEPQFVGPTALVKAHRYSFDPRDDAVHERAVDLSDEHGLWECMRCYFCTQRCPKRIRVRELIAQLGERAVGEGLDADPGARHAQAFVDSLRRSGRLNETDLAVKSQGWAWAARRLPLAVRVALAGKLALPPRPIDGHDALLAVMAQAETRSHERHNGMNGSSAKTGSSATNGSNGGDPRRLSYAYYTGCVPRQSGRELDVATRLVCERLGIGLHRDDRRALLRRRRRRRDQAGAQPRRQRGHAGAGRARRARHPHDLQRLHAEPARRRTRCCAATPTSSPAPTGRCRPAATATAGSVEVTHLLWVLYRDLGPERLAAAVARPLRGLATAAFYGCQVLRPTELCDVDDPDDPRSLEAIVAACGATPVAYEGRTSCCGWPIVMAREDTATAASGAIVAAAREAGAELIVTPCPLCHISLDGYQAVAARRRGEPEPRLPILHLSQLVGLALGLSPLELRLHRHVVSTRAVLARLGLALT